MSFASPESTRYAYEDNSHFRASDSMAESSNGTESAYSVDARQASQFGDHDKLLRLLDSGKVTVDSGKQLIAPPLEHHYV